MVRGPPESEEADSSDRSSRIRSLSEPLDRGSVGGGGVTPDGPAAESVSDLTRAGTGGSGVPADVIVKL